MTSVFPPPRPGLPRVVALLATLVFLALAANNAHELFRTRLYEIDDEAADTLLVHDARDGRALTGHYSRWGFRHPGPAFFYCYAAGEALFYDALGWVPTPFNAQLLAVLALQAGFFAMALGICASWLPPATARIFLCLALVLATCWFANGGSNGAFLSVWPAEVLALPLLCLLAASASVAAGGGNHLPAVVVAGGFLVHGHVAQPLFVVPLTLLGYGGLILKTWPQAPWRRFPRAHVVAAGLLALFLLPLALDALRAGESNLAAILRHLREHHGERKKLVRSVWYFLQFGADGFLYPRSAAFGHFTGAEMTAYARLHWRAYALWTLALAMGAGGLWRAARGGFARRFGALLGAAVLLTLFWGTRQDGDMFYFNAFFNSALWFALALPAAWATAEFLAARFASNARTLSLATLLIFILCAAVAVNADRWRVHTFDEDSLRAMQDNIVQALALDEAVAGSRQKLLVFTQDDWPVAAAVAVRLERLGCQPLVEDDWEIMFSRHRTVSAHPGGTAQSATLWRIVPAHGENAGGDSDALPLPYGMRLARGPSSQRIDPAKEDSINFQQGGNAPSFVCYGWSGPEADAVTGESWSWSYARNALLAFRTATVAADVEMVIEAEPLSLPQFGVPQQRIELVFNGQPLGGYTLSKNAQIVVVRLPVALWNARPEDARLAFYFPDAASPAALGAGTDARLLGGAFRAVRFRLAAPTPAPEN